MDILIPIKGIGGAGNHAFEELRADDFSLAPPQLFLLSELARLVCPSDIPAVELLAPTQKRLTGIHDKKFAAFHPKLNLCKAFPSQQSNDDLKTEANGLVSQFHEFAKAKQKSRWIRTNLFTIRLLELVVANIENFNSANETAHCQLQ